MSTSSRNGNQKSYEELLASVETASYRLLYVDLPHEDLMELSALFNQVTFGECSEPKPVRHPNLKVELEYWQRWKNLGSMSKVLF